MNNEYSTRNEAVQAIIIDPIEAGQANADDFDIDAIADEVIESHTERDTAGMQLGNVTYRQRADVDDDWFWDAVRAHCIK